MDTILEHLETRIFALRRDLEKVNAQISDLVSSRDRMSFDIKAYEATLEAERRCNIGPQLPLPGATAGLHTFTTEPTAGTEDLDINKSEYARSFAIAHPEGFTPKQLLQSFMDDGIKTNPAYIYSLLHRNQVMGHVKQRRKKWYPVAAEQQGTPVLSERTENPAA